MKKLRINPEHAASWQQALICGFFWMAWAVGSYQTVYLQHIGFPASSVGLLNAVCSGVSIVAVTFWGTMSDRIGSVRKVLLILMAVQAVLYSLVPALATALGTRLPLFLAGMMVVQFFRGPTATFNENLIVRNSAEMRLNYGRIRSIGSLFYAVTGLVMVFLLRSMSVGNTFWLSAVCMIPVILLVLFSPEPKNGALRREKRKLHLERLFKNRPYVLFLVFTLLFQMGISCEGSFIPYFMENIGIPSTNFGLLLAYRALLEIPLLLLVTWLRRKVPLRAMIVFAPLLMAAECFTLGTVTNSLPAMILFATFFGMGNGLNIAACLNYVYEQAPDDLKASAQAIYTAVCSVAGIVGNLAGGALFDMLGIRSFYLMTGGLFLVSAAFFFGTAGRKK